MPRAWTGGNRHSDGCPSWRHDKNGYGMIGLDPEDVILVLEKPRQDR